MEIWWQFFPCKLSCLLGEFPHFYSIQHLSVHKISHTWLGHNAFKMVRQMTSHQRLYATGTQMKWFSIRNARWWNVRSFALLDWKSFRKVESIASMEGICVIDKIRGINTDIVRIWMFWIVFVPKCVCVLMHKEKKWRQMFQLMPSDKVSFFFGYYLDLCVLCVKHIQKKVCECMLCIYTNQWVLF